MSVLIKGMEMPTRCGECLLAKLSPTGESLICNYMLSRVPWDERPFDCPLVPVPKHGRLIDADEFLKRALGTKCFRGDYALMLEELVGESTTVIPAEEGE